MCPHPGLILCTLLPLLGTLETIPPPSFLSISTVATIVGYATSTFDEAGNKALTAQFVPISGSGYSIQDIKFSSSDIYGVAIQTLTTGGLADEFFTWNDWTEYPAESGKYPGFWDDGTGVPATKTFAPGEGIWVQGAIDDKMQTAGEVSSNDVVFNLADGNVLVGNAFPVAVSLQDITVTAADIYGVAIQTLTSGGLADEFFTWNDWTEYPADSGNFGFWDDGTGVPSAKQFAPGTALWVQGASGDTLRIPAPVF